MNSNRSSPWAWSASTVRRYCWISILILTVPSSGIAASSSSCPRSPRRESRRARACSVRACSVRACSVRACSARACLVSGLSSLLADHLFELEDGVYQRLGTRWATGYIYVYWYYLVYAFHNTVCPVVVDAAAGGAVTHGYHPARFSHLTVEALHNWRYLVCYCSRDYHQV